MREDQLPPLLRSQSERESDFEMDAERVLCAYVAMMNFSEPTYSGADVLTIVIGNMRRMWWDILRGKLRIPAPPNSHHVAWLRYPNDGSAPHVCDSDAPGAFKVYRSFAYAPPEQQSSQDPSP